MNRPPRQRIPHPYRLAIVMAVYLLVYAWLLTR